MKRTTHTDAWQEGYDAYWEGLEEYWNPYDDIVEWSSWHNGWHAAELVTFFTLRKILRRKTDE